MVVFYGGDVYFCKTHWTQCVDTLLSLPQTEESSSLTLTLCSWKKTSAQSTHWHYPLQVYSLNFPSFSLSSPVTCFVDNFQIQNIPSALKPKRYLVRGIQLFLKTSWSLHAPFFDLAAIILHESFYADVSTLNCSQHSFADTWFRPQLIGISFFIHISPSEIHQLWLISALASNNYLYRCSVIFGRKLCLAKHPQKPKKHTEGFCREHWIPHHIHLVNIQIY